MLCLIDNSKTVNKEANYFKAYEIAGCKVFLKPSAAIRMKMEGFSEIVDEAKPVLNELMPQFSGNTFQDLSRCHKIIHFNAQNVV